MKLSHYTAVPFKLDLDRVYTQHPVSIYEKPVGLWVSVDGQHGWPEWCTAEDFYTESLAFRTIFELKEDANVLVIDSSEGLLNFTEEFGRQDPRGGRPNRPHEAIDWEEVARRYDGLIVSPYNWSLRLDSRTSWYYGWDCASGCIWNLNAFVPPNPVADDCVCNVGVQECAQHPGRLRTQEEKIEFRKDWDRRYEEGAARVN